MDLYRYCANNPIGRVDPLGSSVIPADCTATGFAWDGTNWLILYTCPGWGTWNITGLADRIFGTTPDSITISTARNGLPIYSAGGTHNEWNEGDFTDEESGLQQVLTPKQVSQYGLTLPSPTPPTPPSPPEYGGRRPPAFGGMPGYDDGWAPETTPKPLDDCREETGRYFDKHLHKYVTGLHHHIITYDWDGKDWIPRELRDHFPGPCPPDTDIVGSKRKKGGNH